MAIRARLKFDSGWIDNDASQLATNWVYQAKRIQGTANPNLQVVTGPEWKPGKTSYMQYAIYNGDSSIGDSSGIRATIENYTLYDGIPDAHDDSEGWYGSVWVPQSLLNEVIYEWHSPGTGNINNERPQYSQAPWHFNYRASFNGGPWLVAVHCTGKQFGNGFQDQLGVGAPYPYWEIAGWPREFWGDYIANATSPVQPINPNVGSLSPYINEANQGRNFMPLMPITMNAIHYILWRVVWQNEWTGEFELWWRKVGDVSWTKGAWYIKWPTRVYQNGFGWRIINGVKQNVNIVDMNTIHYAGVHLYYVGSAAALPNDKHRLGTWVRGDSFNDIAVELGFGSGVAPALSVAPTVTPSTPAVGSAVQASTGTWLNNPSSYAYQWQYSSGASYVDITNATDSRYIVETAYVNLNLRCRVRAHNSFGFGETYTAAVGPVASAPTNPPPLDQPLIFDNLNILAGAPLYRHRWSLAYHVNAGNVIVNPPNPPVVSTRRWSVAFHINAEPPVIAATDLTPFGLRDFIEIQPASKVV